MGTWKYTRFDRWNTTMRCSECGDYLPAFRARYGRRGAALTEEDSIESSIRHAREYHRDPTMIGSARCCKTTEVTANPLTGELVSVKCVCPAADQQLSHMLARLDIATVRVKSHEMQRKGDTFTCVQCNRRVKLVRFHVEPYTANVFNLDRRGAAHRAALARMDERDPPVKSVPKPKPKKAPKPKRKRRKKAKRKIMGKREARKITRAAWGGLSLHRYVYNKLEERGF